VNNEKEAQQMLMPVTMCLVVPILMMQYVMRSPNSSLSVILSLIPFFAPILMLQRISILMPPLVQVAGSIAILIATTIGMVWLTGKIYRVGILMYPRAYWIYRSFALSDKFRVLPPRSPIVLAPPIPQWGPCAAGDGAPRLGVTLNLSGL
jgi:hypothetical protein